MEPPRTQDIARLEAKLGEPSRILIDISLASTVEACFRARTTQSRWRSLSRPRGVSWFVRNSLCPFPGHGYDLEEQFETYRGRIPSGVLPIADDPGGNQTCLDVAGAFPGTVWFWDHEQRWFKRDLEQASRELVAEGTDGQRSPYTTSSAAGRGCTRSSSIGHPTTWGCTASLQRSQTSSARCFKSRTDRGASCDDQTGAGACRQRCAD